MKFHFGWFLITIQGAVLCLCQVHNPQRQDNKLEVSIYFMHTNSLLEFTVEDIYENEKVLFDSTVNMLVIYLPNKYLQLIDCGPEHFAHPLPSMTFYGTYRFKLGVNLTFSAQVFGLRSSQQRIRYWLLSMCSALVE